MGYKSIDLFAGIGGIRLGFENVFEDMETVFISEKDKFAQETYRLNFNDRIEIEGDITEVDVTDIPNFDICLAGFPCQAFSTAGKRKGFEDNYKGVCRGTLFFEVARICEVHRPKVIFAENVSGLITHDKGRTLRVIKETFRSIGYAVYTNNDVAIDSKNFGVPQSRKRIYIVCFRNDIDSSGFTYPKGTDNSKRIRDIVEDKEVSVKYYLSDTYLAGLRKHREKYDKKGYGYVIRGMDEIASTVVCGGMGREKNLIIDKKLNDFTPITRIQGRVNREYIRKMTPREFARLQGFPDSYKLEVSDAQLYKQLGNTVTVTVIEEIAKEIKRILDKNDNIC